MTDIAEKTDKAAPQTSQGGGGQGMSGQQWVRMSLELAPLIVFFLLNSQSGNIFGNPPEQNIFYATGGFMIATAISLTATYALHKTIPMMPLVTGGFVLVFGGLTVLLQDEQFIKIKPTITNILFATGLLGGLAFGKPTMKYLFDGAFKLDEMGWRKLTFRWGTFFIFLAIVNEIVWRNFSTDFWVSFKVFGIMPITAVFAMFQVKVVSDHQLVKPEEASKDA